MIKIDRLRGLSIGLLVGAVVLLILEFTRKNPSNESFHFAIPFLLILVMALEKIRLELRDLRQEIDKH
jgi:hypothetical protein